MGRTLLLAFAVGFSARVIAQEIESEPATVSVCELVKTPSPYHGRMVKVRSRVYPAMIDTPVALVDSTCANSIRLDVHSPEEAQNEQGYRDFRRYLSEWRTVEPTVSGRFEMILVPSEEPTLTFRLLRVANEIPGPPFFVHWRKPK